MVSILGANSVSGGYEVSNSVRLNDAYLSRTPSSAGNRRTYTISTWVKRSKFGGDQTIFGSAPTTSVYAHLVFDADDIKFDDYNGGTQAALRTSGVHRDPSAWYHIVLAVDTTRGTESNRLKLYVNGVEPTLDGKSCTQNHESQINNTTAQSVGTLASAYVSGYYFGGYVAETHFIDGAAKAQTDFGEFNDNGVWIPKKYTGTYGTNGFYLQYKQTGTSQNASGIGADTSGQGNHFAVTSLAATDVTEDTCTNNFCTWNPLDTHSGNSFSEGNLKVNGAGSARLCSTTFAPSQGKWYQEFKLTDVNSGSIYNVEQGALALSGNLFVSGSDNTGIYFTGPSVYRNGSNQGDITGGFSDDDILQIALDLDNNNVYYGKNGNWSDGVGGGFDQSDFSNASGFALTRTTSNNNITFSTQNGASASTFELIANWGNPPYAVSSSNNDGKYGNFEYAVPSGYYALCTKRLAVFG